MKRISSCKASDVLFKRFSSGRKREGREALLENVNKVEQLSVHAVHCLPSSILPQCLPRYAKFIDFELFGFRIKHLGSCWFVITK